MCGEEERGRSRQFRNLTPFNENNTDIRETIGSYRNNPNSQCDVISCHSEHTSLIVPKGQKFLEQSCGRISSSSKYEYPDFHCCKGKGTLSGPYALI